MPTVNTWLSGGEGFSFAGPAIDATIKATVLLLLAVAAAALMRRASAAVRHRLWCLTFIGLILLPGLSWALPAWQIPILPPERSAADDVAIADPSETEEAIDSASETERSSLAGRPSGNAEDERLLRADGPPADWRAAFGSEAPEPRLPPQPFESSGPDAPLEDAELTAATAAHTDDEPAGAATWSFPWLAFWLAGCGLVLLPLCVGVAQGLWLAVRATRITDPAWTGLLRELSERLRLTRRVSLLELDRPLIPMTWGVVRPVVLVPRTARGWSDRLRRFVLLHELAHVKRWDVAFQLLARAACAVYSRSESITMNSTSGPSRPPRTSASCNTQGGPIDAERQLARHGRVPASLPREVDDGRGIELRRRDGPRTARRPRLGAARCGGRQGGQRQEPPQVAAAV